MYARNHASLDLQGTRSCATDLTSGVPSEVYLADLVCRSGGKELPIQKQLPLQAQR